MSDSQDFDRQSRRNWMKQTAGGLGMAAMTASTAWAQSTPDSDDGGPIAKHRKIKQSLVHWCYRDAWPNFEDMCRVAVKLGCESIEFSNPAHWPTLKKHGLTCAIANSHGFPTGYNNRDQWDQCTAAIRKSIDACKDNGVKRVITFTGMANGIPKEEGADNCVEGLKQVVGYAEKNDILLCMEILNTRDDSHPMKGHPGYQGDHCDYCIDIIERVGSPNLKLLFDIYHVQIMDGDVIRRIKQHRDHLGHIHTAGNPGRGELDETQEINYPAVMSALLEVGYDGYVGQEFIPTRDPWEGLVQAVRVCDVEK